MKDSLNSRLTELSGISSPFLFQLIYGTLKIANQTSISNEVYLVKGFASIFEAVDTSIENITTDSSFINFASTNFTATNIVSKNITTANGEAPFIFASFDSNNIFSNVTFIDSKSSFIRILSSELLMSNVTISNVLSNSQIFNFVSATNVSISNTKIDLISGSLEQIIKMDSSAVSSIQNLTLSNANTIGIYTYGTKIESIIGFQIENMTQ